MLSRILAHAGENHEDVVESTQHAIDIDPLIASVLIVIIGALIPYLLFRFTKSQTLPIIVGLAEMLIVGILTYSVLPVLSAIALVVGFTLTLMLVFYSM